MAKRTAKSPPKGKAAAKGRKFAQRLGLPEGRTGPTVDDARMSAQEYAEHLRNGAKARIEAAISKLAEGPDDPYPSGRRVAPLAKCSPNLFRKQPYKGLLEDGVRQFLERHPGYRVPARPAARDKAGQGGSTGCSGGCGQVLTLRDAEIADLRARLAALTADPAPIRRKFGLPS